MKKLLAALLGMLTLTIVSVSAANVLLNATPEAQDTTTIESDEEDPYFLLSEQADKAIADGRYGDAEDRIIEAIGLRPNAPSNLLLLSNLGMIYAYTDRDSMAIATFDHILSKAPNMRTVVGHRARVLLKLGKLMDAYDGYERLLEIDSLNTEGRFYHGMLALMARDTISAERDFYILKSIDPDGDATAVGLATLLTEQKKTREALPYVRRMAEAEPSPENYALLAKSLIELEKLSEAGSVIADALKKYPDSWELYLQRAALHRALYEYDAANDDEIVARHLLQKRK